MHFKTFVLLLLSVQLVAGWSCGIGKITNTLSFVLTLPSDLVGVNKCCVEHDSYIDELHIAREEADRVFCECLGGNPDWWVRNIVQPVFCKSVELYSKWFLEEKEKEDDLAQNIFKRLKFVGNF